jgi:hypothetical protein
MGLVAGQDGAVEGYEPVRSPSGQPVPSASEPVPSPSGQPAGPPRAATMFRRRSAQPSRRAVLHLRTSRDAPVPPELATWFTERGFHFYVAGLRGAAGPGRPRRRDGAKLPAAFAGLDARCEQMRAADGIEQVMVTAHGEGALAAALWCASRPGPDSGQERGQERGRADALILYAPEFGRALRRGLDIPCPVLVIGGPGHPPPRRGPALRRPEPAAASQLGRHVTWLRPTDGEARPDAGDAADRGRFFDEMGRWLGAYMYGQVRDRLL